MHTLSDNMSPNNPYISIIIPVFNDSEKLRRCLRSIYDSVFPTFECIVVDDNSTEDIENVAVEFGAKIIRLSDRRGPAYARNQGAESARGSILYFVDADVTIYSDTLQKVARVFDENPFADAVIGSYDDSPADSSFISQYKNLFHHYVHQNANETASTFWTGCGAIKRTVFLEIGGFDCRYSRPAIEDIELGYRLIEDNRHILLEKDLQVTHLKKWTLTGLVKTDVFSRAIPWTMLMQRYRKIPIDLNLQISQRLSTLLIYLAIFLVCGIALLGQYFPVMWMLLALIFLSWLYLNRQLLNFFFEKRGALFSLAAIPMLLLYYFYSGLGFILGTLFYLSGRRV